MDGIDPSLMALAVSIGFFVNVAVDIVKKMLGRSTKRRWVLPITGVIFGWLFGFLTLSYRGTELTWPVISGVILVGFLAAGLAALQNDQSKQAETS